jgi:DNA mismatch endonuclease (patch repair protein)
MTDVYDQEKRSTVMRSVHSSQTKPEMIVQQMLESLGYHFLLHQHDLPGRPDIVFPERHKVIFVHGCFWHQHPNCKQAARPQSNTNYWNKKLDRNILRDKDNIRSLRADGWEILILWECEVKNKQLLKDKISSFVEDNYK